VLTLTVRDTGPGIPSLVGQIFPPAERPKQPGTVNGKNGKGMGLAITRARLDRLYGTDHRFELVNPAEGGLLVTLEIPFHASNTEQVL
jgi:K+-sensing histidine kinase KdpD